MNTLLSSEGLHLAASTVTRLGEISFLFCNIYTDLSREAHDEGVKAWKSTPKLHLFNHLGEWVVQDFPINPQNYWTYADEDLVGVLVDIGSSCHVSTLAAVALTKWLLLALMGRDD